MRLRRILLVGAGLIVVGGVLAGAYLYTQRGAPPRFRTQAVSRGTVTAAISATGNLNAVITVLVGSQVSGQIRELFADFNSQVKRGQLIARIDPAIFEARVNQARAELEAVEAAVLNQRAQVERARAEVDNARAALAAAKAQTAKAAVLLADAARDLERKSGLFQRELIARSEQDSAQAAHDSAAAQVESAQAQEQALASAIRSAEAQARVVTAQLTAAEATVRQKRAALEQAQVDLAYTFIRAPVDGVVVSRNVDVGQTVAASLAAPTLFTIAQDLTKMQIDTNLDEADIGRIREGQRATFTVDSFPTETFTGQVVQIRKAPRTIQNVVTYNVVIGFDNADQKLLPGMTANVRVVVDVRPDVLRVPNAALRFRPPGEEPPATGASAESPTSPPPASAGGFPTMEQTRDRLTQALKLTEDQLKRLDPILEEMYGQFRGLARIPQEQRRAAAMRIREEGRQKMRALLTPEQQATFDQMPAGQAGRGGSGGRAGRIFVLDAAGRPQPLAVRLGISDGTYTELLGGDLKDGQEIIVGAAGGAIAPASRPPASPAQQPGSPRMRL
jgi:HlyD family secretion protein